jgi:hypothetical protein
MISFTRKMRKKRAVILSKRSVVEGLSRISSVSQPQRGDITQAQGNALGKSPASGQP